MMAISYLSILMERHLKKSVNTIIFFFLHEPRFSYKIHEAVSGHEKIQKYAYMVHFL